MSLMLYLCRHGNTFESNETPRQVGAKTDLPLTAFGQEQAKALGRFFSQQGPIQTIYCGPLKRQQQTAAMIQAALQNVSLSTTPLLSELDYGVWEGLTSDEIKAKWPEAYAAWQQSHRWPEHLFGASKASYEKNLQDFLSSLRALPVETKNVIAVTSNGILQLLHGLVAPGEMIRPVKTGHWCQLEIERANIHILKWNEKPD